MYEDATVTTRPLEELVDRAAARAVSDDLLADRYRAVMLGVAAGNVLGLEVEGMSHAAIRRSHPDGVREVPAAERGRPWDDDLAQTYLLAEVLLRTQELNVDLFAQELVRWGRENGRGMGGLTAEVLSELGRGTPAGEAARVVWERTGWSNAGNGAVMRCAPVALRHRGSGAAVVRNARASALVTHFDARCEWSTVVVCVALAVALSGEPPSVPELMEATEALGEQDVGAAALGQLTEAMGAADGATLEQLELDDAMDMGYTLKAMQVVLWALQQEGDFESVVGGVVDAGGDTDTNAALAGAASGARGSVAQIPSRWLSNVADAEELSAVADRLFTAARAG